MSEELIQISPKPLGRYLYYRIGSTTLSQLKRKKVIKGGVPQYLSSKKPDGLIILPGGDVKAVVEYKQPRHLRNDNQEQKAIDQGIDVAKHLCKLLIITSGKKTIWINALNGERVLSENGEELKQTFDAQPIEKGALSSEREAELEQLIDKIDHSLTNENNTIALPDVVDPSQLARTIWQKIWLNTGKDPEKCLYNVVELFVFKFLSDVGVLRAHKNFSYVYKLTQDESSVEALKHYAGSSRKEIEELFPKGEDGTTIINGTIFVNEKGEPNPTQAGLFSEVLEHLQKYDSDIGSFKYIKREFKTRLYESFLRQDAAVRSLGQYFTPRNVVRAIVEMSDASNLTSGARVCDPFCGVGGFLLELIAGNDHILKEFEPKDKEVKPGITIIGYDKGSDEKEDERTIVLAKANMLIYFSDLLVKYNTKEYLKAFSTGAFNEVFHLLRTNLGTFGKVGVEPFDLIVTNPPYVTSGSSSLKKAIEDQGLSEHYTFGGRGTEALALEWIVNHLKEKGQAQIIVPDGLLNQATILTHLKANCIIEGVVSLPIRTFYSTPKKTYILALRKKEDVSKKQNTPVFTYVVSEIGETRDAKRWPTPEKNDLEELVPLFNQFKGAKSYFESNSIRCKIIDYRDFSKQSNWMVDRWWTQEERVLLGIDSEVTEISLQELIGKMRSVSKTISASVEALDTGEWDAIQNG